MNQQQFETYQARKVELNKRRSDLLNQLEEEVLNNNWSAASSTNNRINLINKVLDRISATMTNHFLSTGIETGGVDEETPVEA